MVLRYFANANHQAAFLYCTICFAAGWAFAVKPDREGARRFSFLMLALLMAGAVLGVGLTNSRAGIGLTFVAGVACLWLIKPSKAGRPARWVTLGAASAILVGFLIAFQFSFVSLMNKSEGDSVLHNLRWSVASATSRAALATMPFGTGLGTFVPIYKMYEPRTSLIPAYVNHAHDDWLELWLTGGVPALIIILGFWAWFGMAAYSQWRISDPKYRTGLIYIARAGSIAIGLLALHSAVDYPLRTIALSTLFAICCALLLPPLAADKRNISSTGLSSE